MTLKKREMIKTVLPMQDDSFYVDLKNDVGAECEEKCGEVDKLTVFEVSCGVPASC